MALYHCSCKCDVTYCHYNKAYSIVCSDLPQGCLTMSIQDSPALNATTKINILDRDAIFLVDMNNSDVLSVVHSDQRPFHSKWLGFFPFPINIQRLWWPDESLCVQTINQPTLTAPSMSFAIWSTGNIVLHIVSLDNWSSLTQNTWISWNHEFTFKQWSINSLVYTHHFVFQSL